MKVLKIFGVVLGVHALALMLIFVNPGCSSANKPPPPSETVIADGGVSAAPVAAASEPAPISVAAVTGDEGAPVVRFSPTRPNTPVANALERQPVTDVVPASTYTVVSGDSLWTIARKHHLSVAELAAANNIKAGAVVRIGQKLIIPAKMPSTSASVVDTSAPKPSAPAPARSSGEAVRHVVKPGETLGGIARKYQVRVGDIATANNIADPAKIRPGMELTIPGWRAPAANRAAKSEPAPATAAPVQTPEPTPAPATEVPTLVIPPIDSASSSEQPAAEPPVIKVDDQ